jgi:deoxyribodipyrimidine photolyase-related protein
MDAFIIYPHQLYEPKKISKALDKPGLDYIFIVEEYLYFRQYNFHPLKLKFHRETMKEYEIELKSYFADKKSPKIVYISSEELDSVEALIDLIDKKYDIKAIECYDPTDDWLRHRTMEKCRDLQIQIVYKNSPNFLFRDRDLIVFFSQKKTNWLMNNFYIYARKKMGILLENGEKPIGGKWSFDSENRKKIPDNISLPNEVEFEYATSRKDARQAMKLFFETKFHSFGVYEDAIVSDKNFLFHSVLSPYINVGLLNPREVVEEALNYYENNKEIISLSTIEGFIRQIIGWREYMRAVYIIKGREIRTKNYFGFTKKLPNGFWTAQTGNVVIDKTIKKTLKYAYNHHIERLMILGNWMLIEEYDPNEVYRWFMEMYIDSYDWVMVPNVYSMSQYSDGGLITTKPYISGSNYIKKMSDYGGKKGEAKFGADWAENWDEKYWNFVYKHRDRFEKNPRMSMMVQLAKKRFE